MDRKVKVVQFGTGKMAVYTIQYILYKTYFKILFNSIKVFLFYLLVFCLKMLYSISTLK